MMARLLVLALPLLLPPALCAQVELRGMVVDATTGSPVAGARIRFEAWDGIPLARAVTDSAGAFTHTFRRAGAYRLRIDRLGYAPVTSAELHTGSDPVVAVELRLTPDAVLMAAVTVVTRASPVRRPVLEGFDLRRTSGFGTFFTRADVERLQPHHVTDVVARVPGFRVSGTGRGNRRELLGSRGERGRGCPVQLWVDGVHLNPRAPGGAVAGLNLDEAVLPGDVEGIEVYRSRGTVPAEFLNDDAACGVVVVWTRRGPRA
jgi:hypothetical protein